MGDKPIQAVIQPVKTEKRTDILSKNNGLNFVMCVNKALRRPVLLF